MRDGPWVNDITISDAVSDDLARCRPAHIGMLLLHASASLDNLPGRSGSSPFKEAVCLARDLAGELGLDRNLTGALASTAAVANGLAYRYMVAEDMHLGQLRRARERMLAREGEYGACIDRSLALALAGEPSRLLGNALYFDLGRSRARESSRPGWLRQRPALLIGRALAEAVDAVLPSARIEDWTIRLAQQLARITGIDKERDLPAPASPGRLEPVLAVAATALRQALGELAPDDEFRHWPLTVTGRLQRNASAILSHGVPPAADAAAIIRLPALCLAREADTAGREETADMFRQVAAGITLLERPEQGT